MKTTFFNHPLCHSPDCSCSILPWGIPCRCYMEEHHTEYKHVFTHIQFWWKSRIIFWAASLCDRIIQYLLLLQTSQQGLPEYFAKFNLKCVKFTYLHCCKRSGKGIGKTLETRNRNNHSPSAHLCLEFTVWDKLGCVRSMKWQSEELYSAWPYQRMITGWYFSLRFKPGFY